MIDRYYSFRLTIEGSGRTIIDTTVGAKPDPDSITKAKSTIQEMLDNFTPVVAIKAQGPTPPLATLQPGTIIDLAPENSATTGQQDRPPEADAPTITRRPDGAKGMICVRCPECNRIFGTFLREYQTEIDCKCGHKIDLTGQLGRYRFTCPYCEKETWGQTNLEDPEITIRCKCGGDIELRWNPKAKEYQN